MPNGFVGKAASRYLKDVSDAHKEALSTCTRISSNAPSRTTLRIDTEQQMAHSPEEARSGKFITGKNNSTNIVADQNEYEKISHKISQADDRMGECLYRIAQEIEEMCQNSYKLPWAVPRCLNITNSVKSSMGEFRSLTEEAVAKVRSYARDITEIG